MTTQDNASNICCPAFEPSSLDGKELVWKDKLFIKGSIPLLFHIPWPPMMGRLMKKMWEAAGAADAAPEMKDFLCLSYDRSPWRGEHYLSVTKEVPGIENVRLSGTFLTKVFDGPYSAVPKWIKEMDAYVKSQGKQPLKYYFYYTTCPKCIKVHGHNYVVAFAQVE